MKLSECRVRVETPLPNRQWRELLQLAGKYEGVFEVDGNPFPEREGLTIMELGALEPEGAEMVITHGETEQPNRHMLAALLEDIQRIEADAIEFIEERGA